MTDPGLQIAGLNACTPFAGSIKVAHIGVNGPIGMGWALSVEPKDHPTIREPFLLRLDEAQVKFLIGSFLFLEPGLSGHVRACEDQIAHLDQCVFGDSSNVCQADRSLGTPIAATVDGGSSVSPACSAASAEDAS